MPRTRLSIDKMRAELVWVNEPLENRFESRHSSRASATQIIADWLDEGKVATSMFPAMLAIVSDPSHPVEDHEIC